MRKEARKSPAGGRGALSHAIAVSLRYGWLIMLVLWQWQAVEFWGHIIGAAKEPVTESEYEELERKAREEYLPVRDAAIVLTERHDGFTEAARMRAFTIDIDPRYVGVAIERWQNYAGREAVLGSTGEAFACVVERVRPGQRHKAEGPTR